MEPMRIWQKIIAYIKKKRGKGYTVMVVPNFQGTTKSLSIPFFLTIFCLCLLAADVYFLCRYPGRLLKISHLEQKIDQLSDIIARQERDLKQINPSIEKTHEMEERLNNTNKLIAEIRETLNSILHKAGQSRSANRGYTYRPISLPSYNLSSADNDLTRLEILNTNLDFVEKELEKSEERLDKLSADLRAFNKELDYTPTIWPVYGRITSGFGYRIHPISRKHDFHRGIDIAARKGTPIRAAAGGRIVRANFYGGYGWTVIIDHGYGYRTLYAHNRNLVVRQGQYVSKGQVVAYSGDSGNTTGPHLHYEVHVNGKPVNPTTYLWQ